MAIFRRSPDIAPCGFTGTHHFAFAALALVCVWCSTIVLLHAYQVSRSRAYWCNPQGNTVASNGGNRIQCAARGALGNCVDTAGAERVEREDSLSGAMRHC